MISILFVSQIILSLLVVIVVLMQKSSSIGLGAYSSSNESVFGAKGPASFMSKLTFTLGALFLANTIALGYFYNKDFKKSLIETNKETIVPQSPLENKLQTPSAPIAPLLQNKE
ncbi:MULTISPECIES: preprotein translocase subunit SecG [unclassified Helicobacter]|uniref:preprotein translocase subunit SecG n=1 Tax=unclassified Helicobacter TaxID=2593540 RepID=UPI000CF0ABDD|nr:MULTISPECIES: preprotein translocase subunit SecG [unclassified Helicobacter]